MVVAVRKSGQVAAYLFEASCYLVGRAADHTPLLVVRGVVTFFWGPVLRSVARYVRRCHSGRQPGEGVVEAPSTASHGSDTPVFGVLQVRAEAAVVHAARPRVGQHVVYVKGEFPPLSGSHGVLQVLQVVVSLSG